MALTVGVREFRQDLADYIDGDEPVTVTRHGRRVGVFIPTRGDRAEGEEGEDVDLSSRPDWLTVAKLLAFIVLTILTVNLLGAFVLGLLLEALARDGAEDAPGGARRQRRAHR